MKLFNVVLLAGVVGIVYFYRQFTFNSNDESESKDPLHDPTYHHHYEQYLRKLENTVTYEKLQDVIVANKDYRQQFPFPHGRYQDLFPQDVLDAVSSEIPDAPVINTHSKKAGCVRGSGKCYSESEQKFKNAFDDESKFGPATLAVFRMMKSPLFTSFLENMTGIYGLIPDPEYRGSGIHQTLPGGYLGIHADFNLYPKYNNIHRRVNALLFLNDDWKAEYGGAIELWHKDLKSCGAKYLPLMNRLVVFSSTDFSYHGQPHPLTAPKDRSRRSLALYYYTKTRPTSECVDGQCFTHHTTLFKKTHCSDCEELQCRNISESRYAL